jgi:hypothetical protein
MKSNPFEGLFERIENQQEVRVDFQMPDNLKDAVFSTLDATSLVADIVDLFTVKLIQTQSELLDALPQDDLQKILEAKKQKFFDDLSKRPN